ncbi:MAG: S8 family serine peptidase [Candidatus Thermoplasmatota archaeon]|nr:S8 family serine peptidase [Candidatus Thermoplasmatota archaeon]
MSNNRNRALASSMALLMTIATLLSTTVAMESPGIGDLHDLTERYLVRTLWGDIVIGELMERVPVSPMDERSEIYIVQFQGPVLREWSDSLVRSGVDILGYLPDMCYVVRSEEIGPDDLLQYDGVTGVSHFPSGLKVSPTVHDALVSDPAATEVSGSDRLMVDLFYPDPTIKIELARISSGVEVGSSTRYVLELPIISLEALISIPSIQWIEPRLRMELHNNVSKDIIGVQTVWDTLGLDGSGQKVAIADTGIDTGVDNHSVNGDIIADFDNRVTTSLWAGPNSNDTHSHGTHTTGSIAGNGSNSNGSIRGMAPEAEIFFQSIANQNAGNRLELPSNLSLLFQDAYDFGARVHSNSWGAAYAGAYTTNSRDVDWFLYYHPDMIILFSAGNDGIDYYKPYGTYNPDGKIDDDSIGSPATSKSAITVGASENYRTEGGYQFQWGTGSWLWKYSKDPITTDKMSDDPTGMAAFSSRGPTNDGRIKPDVVAPGTNILSVRSTQTSATGWGAYQDNSQYIFMGGTSMSTPITAGTVVLLREYYEEILDHNSPSGALLKATLINGALDMTPGQYGSDNETTQEITGRPDNAQGWGRIDIRNSLVPRVGATVSYIDQKVGVQTNDVVTRYVNVNSTDDLRLTLAWSDYPAAAYAAKTLVNDLDIIITAPNGTTYHGNDLLSPFNDTTDRTNPVEGIKIPTPAMGWWKVEVKAYNIPMGPQNFGLAANYELIQTGNVLGLETYRKYVSTGSDNVTVSVFNPSQTSRSSVNVHIFSDSDPPGKNIVLNKIGPFGQFTGFFLTSNTSTPSPSSLYVSHDDIINVSYSYSTSTLYSEITAKDPVRIAVQHTMELGLVQSEHEVLHLMGETLTGTRTFWKFQGMNDVWSPFFDDGSNASGDLQENDGNVSAVWTVPNGTFGTFPLVTLVEDPFLGPLMYGQFNVTFNTSLPRYPKNLTATTLGGGNTVLLRWDESNETDLSHYSAFVNLSGPTAFGTGEWKHIANTTSVVSNMTIGNLTDGMEHWFRLSAVDINGNASSLSLPFNVTPTDTEPPVVDLITTPYTIVGVADLLFVGSPDLAMVEMQYYNDSNGNGLEDDGIWMDAGMGYPENYTWDTRNVSGGPGNIDSMFLRYRGYDEVPNISEWVVAFGFRIDNLGPSSVEILNPPPRITNSGSYQLDGRSEASGYVQIWKNGSMDSNSTVNEMGSFSFDLDLDEGFNNITLAAFDQYGAGPTIRTYLFTLDTMLPVPIIDVEDQEHVFREIMGHQYLFNSTSYDTGYDTNFTYIENITWTYRGPDGVAKVRYGTDQYLVTFTEMGDHHLSLYVRDPAGNSDEMTLMITVYDNTSPVMSVEGELEVDEDTLVTYDLNWTDNDPWAHLREDFSIEWSFTGPYGFIQDLSSPIVHIVFPEPGIYSFHVKIRDGGGNTAELEMNITVDDITPPAGNIQGMNNVILGIPETYTANLTDNGRPIPDGCQYDWSLQYLEGPPSQWWTYNFSGPSFDHNFTEPGSYTLLLLATDPYGNFREFQINIYAEGDLTPPRVAEVLPAPNGTYQFSEDMHFIVRFSERMDKASINSASVHLLDPNGTDIPATLTVSIKEERTEVLLQTDTLEFELTYSLVVEPTVRDTWGNALSQRFTANYTIRTQFRLVFPWGSSHSGFFENITNTTAIVLRFSNPVSPSSIVNYISIRVITKEIDIYTGKERIIRTPTSFMVKQGEDNYTVIVEAVMDEGATYNFTISEQALDIFNYQLDQTYMWDFKTYLPPVTEDENDDDVVEEDPLPDWMEDPKWWIIAAVLVVVLFMFLMIFGVIRRRKNLDRIWEAGKEEEAMRGRSIAEPEPSLVEEAPPLQEEEEGATIEPPSYEDLYGTPPDPAGQGPDTISSEEVHETSDLSRTMEASSRKEIDWDEDEDEPEEEDWGDGEELDEEDWDG